MRGVYFLGLTVAFHIIITNSNIVYAEKWQQKLVVDIDVALVDSIRSLVGTEAILYQNNSPDTLSVIYFRLAPEALRANSPVGQSMLHGHARGLKHTNEEEWGSLRVTEVSSIDQRTYSFEQDGSIGSLKIEPPMLPGSSAHFIIEFITKFPIGGAAYRISFYEGQYKGAYWFPAVCSYTAGYGWTVNRYYGTAEAYGEFGDYSINYRVPYRYIVASTGELVNQAEILPASRLAGISIDSHPPSPIPDGEDGDSLVTWRYQALNVPDVAFVADPEFLIDIKEYDSFQAWAFVRRGKQNDWRDAAELCGWTIEQLEDIYGPYPWPRVMMTDSWSAMEYPMLTMMYGGTPQYIHTLIHEVVHNYTPMIIHSNSVDAPVLDEGFTTYLEQELFKRYKGKSINRTYKVSSSFFTRKDSVANSDVRLARPFLKAVLAGEDLPMVRGADVAADYPLLRASTYYKTPVMLNALRGVIGDEAFWAGFRQYYKDCAFTHPTERDMIAAFEKGSGRALGWFFNQYLFSDEDLDYSIHKVRENKLEGSRTITLEIKREGGIKLPLTVELTMKDGACSKFAIPFLESDWIAPGTALAGSWDQLHDPAISKQIVIRFDEDVNVDTIRLNPGDSFLDRSAWDNAITRLRSELATSDGLFKPLSLAPLDRYRNTITPSIGYKNYEKVIVGFNLKRDFLESGNRFKLNLHSAITEKSTSPFAVRYGAAIPFNMGRSTPEITMHTGLIQQHGWISLGVQNRWRSFETTQVAHTFSTSWWILGDFEPKVTNFVIEQIPYRYVTDFELLRLIRISYRSIRIGAKSKDKVQIEIVEGSSSEGRISSVDLGYGRQMPGYLGWIPNFNLS